MRHAMILVQYSSVEMMRKKRKIRTKYHVGVTGSKEKLVEEVDMDVEVNDIGLM